MSRQQSSASSRSSNAEDTFPFQHDDHSPHQTLLPVGILNDDDDDDDNDERAVSWPRNVMRGESGGEKCVFLKVSGLPQDLTTREFAGLFLMADGFMSADLIFENEKRIGLASFVSQSDAEKAKQKMSQVSTGPFARLSFEITTRRAHDTITPPATLSSSSKSPGSNGSLLQISRLTSYVKEKSNEAPFGVDDFYGPAMPKPGTLAGSVPSNFSTSAGTTVWSPTSPRFPADLAKSPPNSLSMLPPPTSKEDDSWNRSGTQNSLNNARFSQLSVSTQHLSQDVRVQQSPVLNGHASTGALYASIDDSIHATGGQRGASYTGTSQTQMYHASSPPKHYMASPSYAPSGPGVFNTHRMGPPTPVNTNPADQNPPCNTLYVGNLPLATTEEELKSLFSRQPGYRRLCYRTKSNGPMCFVEFEDVHYAINSLKLLQGVVLSSSIKGGIRLSFSKNPLGVRKMDNGHAASNGGAVNAASSNGHYNAMHAPPGLHSGQSYSHNAQQATVSPIWR